jgi:hypothetical protein
MTGIFGTSSIVRIHCSAYDRTLSLQRAVATFSRRHKIFADGSEAANMQL